MSDSDRNPQANGNGARPAPFAGITVLDFSHQAAGPWATTLLGDLGANVIKIEKPGRGDAIRYGQGKDTFDIGSLNFWGLNRSKRGITLDFMTDEGRALVLKMVEKADVDNAEASASEHGSGTEGSAGSGASEGSSSGSGATSGEGHG